MTPQTTIRYMAEKIEQALGHSYGWEMARNKPCCRYCGAHSHEGHDHDCRVKDMESPLYLALRAAEQAQKEAA